jgi:hypothetical protein
MPGPTNIIVIDYFQIRRFRGLIYKIRGTQDNMPNKYIGKQYFCRTWPLDDFPQHNQDPITNYDGCLEQDKLNCDETIGGAVATAINYALRGNDDIGNKSEV